MSKKTKAWLTAAAVLILGGCILFAAVMSTLKWDFTKLSTVKYETNTYEIAETFSDISIATDGADIVFALSDNGKCIVECREEEKAKHSAAACEGKLDIRINNQKSWKDYIGFNLGSPKIKIYLPKNQYKTLTVSGRTGDIEIPKDISFENTKHI